MGNWDAALGREPGPAERWPLVAHGVDDLSRPFAWHAGLPITVADFLRDVAPADARLPATAHVLNACSDRYLFAVALGACMQRGIITLLPPARTPGEPCCKSSSLKPTPNTLRIGLIKPGFISWLTGA